MALTDLPAHSGIIAVQISLVGDTGPMYCTCGAVADTAESVGSEDSQDLVEAFATALEECMTSTYSMTTGSVRWNNTGVTGPADTLHAPTFALKTGNVDGIAVPQNVAALVRKVTGRAGRGANGRLYIPGVSQEIVGSDGNLFVEARENYDEAFANLITAWQGISGGFTPIVINHGVAPGYDLETPGTVGTFVTSVAVATQRRRLR